MWVTIEWWEPEHWGCENSELRKWRERPRIACDLSDVPVRQYPNRPRFGYWGYCHWDPVWPPRSRRRGFSGNAVPKWFIDHVWNGPERVRERDGLKALRDEYNAHGDLEDGDFPCWQTRSFAKWMWD